MNAGRVPNHVYGRPTKPNFGETTFRDMPSKVDRIRGELAAGTYEDESKLAGAVAKLQAKEFDPTAEPLVIDAHGDPIDGSAVVALGYVLAFYAVLGVGALALGW